MEATMHTSIDRAESLRAYPTLSAAARMIGVAPSTLTRRNDLEPLQRGDRDQVLPPVEVLRLAAIYRKQSLNQVAADLVAAAVGHGAEEAQRVEAAVEDFFSERSADRSVDGFLSDAKRFLPAELYEEVEKAVMRGEGRRPVAITGHVPPPHVAEQPKPRAASNRKASPSGKGRKASTLDKRGLAKVRS